jgi:hypothetical protein
VFSTTARALAIHFFLFLRIFIDCRQWWQWWGTWASSSDCSQPTAPHFHVLFLQQIILHWFQLFHCHHPQNAGELPSEEGYDLLFWVHSPVKNWFSWCVRVNSWLSWPMITITICSPLLYNSIMSAWFCLLLVWSHSSQLLCLLWPIQMPWWNWPANPTKLIIISVIFFLSSISPAPAHISMCF